MKRSEGLNYYGLGWYDEGFKLRVRVFPQETQNSMRELFEKRKAKFGDEGFFMVVMRSGDFDWEVL